MMVSNVYLIRLIFILKSNSILILHFMRSCNRFTINFAMKHRIYLLHSWAYVEDCCSFFSSQTDGEIAFQICIRSCHRSSFLFFFDKTSKVCIPNFRYLTQDRRRRVVGPNRMKSS